MTVPARYPVHLSLIIPAFNEEARLPQALKKVGEFVRQRPYALEVLLVDDGSRDGTRGLMDEFARGCPECRVLGYAPNRGKGAAVKEGMLAARGEFCLFSDADLSTPLAEVDRFLKIMAGEPDMAGLIGSRRLKGAKLAVRQPFFREACGRVFSVLVRFVTLPGFLDTQCGFKMLRQDAARAIFSRTTIPGFGFDVEMLFIARKLGLKLREVPVEWADSANTKVRLFKDSTRMFVDLLLIRWRNGRGRYSQPGR